MEEEETNTTFFGRRKTDEEYNKEEAEFKRMAIFRERFDIFHDLVKYRSPILPTECAELAVQIWNKLNE